MQDFERCNSCIEPNTSLGMACSIVRDRAEQALSHLQSTGPTSELSAQVRVRETAAAKLGQMGCGFSREHIKEQLR